METFGILLIAFASLVFEFIAEHWWKIIALAWGILLIVVLASVRDNIVASVVLLTREVEDLRKQLEKYK